MQLRACVSWSQTLCGQMRSKPVSKGHISVSPAAKHCLRYPKPQASRLQSCSSSRARDQGLPPPHGYQKTQNQEGCMTEIHRKNHHPMGVKMKVSSGAPCGLGSSCSPGRGHKRRLSRVVTCMLTYTCWSPVHILLTFLIAAQAPSSCQLTTCFFLPVSEPLMFRIRNENSVSLSAKHWGLARWFRTFKATSIQKPQRLSAEVSEA